MSVPAVNAPNLVPALPARIGAAREDARLARRVLANSGAMLLADAGAIVVANSIALELRRLALGPARWDDLSFYTVLVLWLLASLGFRLFPGYGLDAVERLRRAAKVAAATTVAGVVAAFAAYDPSSLSRLILVLTVALGVPASLLLRSLVRGLLARADAWGVPVALAGDGPAARELEAALLADVALGYRPVPVGRIEREAPDLAFLAMPEADDAARARLLDGPLAAYRRVLVVTAAPAGNSRWTASQMVGRQALLELRRDHFCWRQRLAKRTFDLAVVILGGIVVLPVLLVLALIVRLDSRGPALFRHRRVGMDGRELSVWKFRTMHADADERLERVLAEDEGRRIEWARDRKLRNDPRVTRVGRWLRKTSLDELPQLLSVLAGSMSLVGPRPIVQAEIPMYGEWYQLYAQVPAGMTGLWQVSGRNNVGYEERVALDAHYVRHWSVWLDLVILAQTLRAIVGRRGAY